VAWRSRICASLASSLTTNTSAPGFAVPTSLQPPNDIAAGSEPISRVPDHGGAAQLRGRSGTGCSGASPNCGGRAKSRLLLMSSSIMIESQIFLAYFLHLFNYLAFRPPACPKTGLYTGGEETMAVIVKPQLRKGAGRCSCRPRPVIQPHRHRVRPPMNERPLQPPIGRGRLRTIADIGGHFADQEPALSYTGEDPGPLRPLSGA